MSAPPRLPNKLSHFAQSKGFSFVRPDGRFALMEYRFDYTTSPAQLQVQVPFTPHASLSVTNHGGPSFLPQPSENQHTHNRRVRAVVHPARRRTRRCHRVDVRARTAHAALVPRPLHLHDPRSTGSASVPGRTATLRGTFVSGDVHPRAVQISFAPPAGGATSRAED
ncbi:hypothetical protein EDB83DRAFT_1411543 [Lactarius deliciosus]|nr:hypothetical protein EDB83DRAFT_1411543 [Lactarius deliciosus]